MPPLASAIIALWLIGGLITLSIILYIIRKGAEIDKQFARDPSVHVATQTPHGRVVMVAMCLLLWPAMVVKLLWVLLKVTLDAWRQRRLDQQMNKAFDGLAGSVAKISADIDDPELKQKLDDAVADLRRLMKGDSDGDGEGQV